MKDLGRQFVGIVVIGVITVNIVIALAKCSSSGTKDDYAASPLVEDLVVEEPCSEDLCVEDVCVVESPVKPKTTQSSDLSDTNIDLIYRVDGCTDPVYYWTVRVINGRKVFQYIIADPYTGEQTIARSGNWGITTFGELKAEHPGLRLHNRSLSSSQKVILVSPVESYGDRNVEGMIVPHGKSAEIYLNDDDDPMEFFLLDNLIRQ